MQEDQEEKPTPSTMLKHELKIKHAFGASFSSEIKDSLYFLGDQQLQLLFPIGRKLGFRELNPDQGSYKTLCGKIDDNLDKVTAMAISSNRQCVALACKFLNDKSAYILFFDLTQNMKRYGRIIHEEVSTSTEDKSFISIAFSSDANRIAALTNLTTDNAKMYEWKKDVRVVSACSCLDELKKETKTEESIDIKKVTMDPNNKEQICITGKYHMRLWRNHNGLFKPLPAILKLDNKKVFTDHVWIDNNWLVVSTDKGEICFIYESRICVHITSAFGKTIEPVSCLLAYNRGVIIGGENGLIAFWEKKEIGKKLEDEASLREVNQHEKNVKIESRGKIVAMSISSKLGIGYLAIAYKTNFIALLKMTELLQKEELPGGIDLNYLDEGYHLGRISEETDPIRMMYTVMDMDVATHRPLLATCCKTDSTLRIWNYLTLECEMVKCLTLQQAGKSPEPVRPLSIAFHPSGYILVGGFDSQAIIWHVMMNELRQFYVFQDYKQCSKVKFSHGGSMLCIAQMFSTQKAVFVHHSFSLKKLYTIKIPSNVVLLDISFSENDLYIGCSCTEGVTIIFNTITKEESMTHASRKCIYSTCFVNGAQDIIVMGADDTQRGMMRRIVQQEIKENFNFPNTMKVTSACFLSPSNFAIGTNTGLVRLYEYPNTGRQYFELNMHSAPVSKLLISPNKRFVFSCGEDGVIFLYDLIMKNSMGIEEEKKIEATATIGVIEPMSEVVLVEKGKMKRDQKNLDKLGIKVKELERERRIVEETLLFQHQKKLEELEKEKRNALKELDDRLRVFKKEISKKDNNFSDAYQKMESNHQASILELDAVYRAKIDRERKNYLNLEQKLREDMHKDRELEIIQDHERYEKDLDKLSSKLKEVKEAQFQAEKKYESKLLVREEEHDAEMDQREIHLHKEINLLYETIKAKDNELNQIDAYMRELNEEKRELAIKNQDLVNLQEQLQSKITQNQTDLDKVKNESKKAMEEAKDLNASLTKLKAKYKIGVKDKQTLIDIAKGLKDKLGPAMENNTDMKKRIKEIEEEYTEYMEIIEQQKKASERQESIIQNIKKEMAKREKIIKEKDARLKEIADTIYKYRERVCSDKTVYPEFYRELYHKYVSCIIDSYTDSPDAIDELNKRITYLQEKSSSTDAINKMKKRQLEKMCQSLRTENSKLIKELNQAVEKLNNSNRYQASLEGKVNSLSLQESALRKMVSSSMQYKTSPERSLIDIDKSSSMVRMTSPKSCNSGKIYKGLAHHLHARYPAESEKVSELTQQLQESYDKIFQLKMEIMMLKKGASKDSIKKPNKSEIDTSQNDHSKDSENAASSSFLPQLGSGRSLSKKNLQFIKQHQY